jgi:uncharacterized membrane protein YfcA
MARLSDIAPIAFVASAMAASALVNWFEQSNADAADAIPMTPMTVVAMMVVLNMTASFSDSRLGRTFNVSFDWF